MWQTTPIFLLSPEKLDQEAIHQYLLYLLNERKLSPESVNNCVSALKFLYLTTLEMPWTDDYFPRAKRPYKLPVVLSHEEILLFFDHVPSLKNRAALMICYGAGLRVSEAVALKVSDIDGQRMLIRVEQGKGQKDRYAMLSDRLLDGTAPLLASPPARKTICSPPGEQDRHMNAATLQLACREAAAQPDCAKKVTVHGLRHSFRHPSARTGNRCARDSGSARPQRDRHHRPLHEGIAADRRRHHQPTRPPGAQARKRPAQTTAAAKT